MAREPLNRPARRRWLGSAAALLIVAGGCRDDLPYEGAFDMPVAAAVLQPEVGGPFQEPVGFVANGIGGNLIPLDLKTGRFLTDDPTASFLRTNWLPTGGNRLLSSVVAYAPAADQVTLFAGDRASATLLRVPYVVGIDAGGFPIDGWVDDAGEVQTGPVVVDVRPSVAGSVVLQDIETKVGWTTTETWTVRYEPVRQVWEVEGSRSGRQEAVARPGIRWVGDRRRLAFTVIGQGQPGDVFEIDTDAGIREIDVGGAPSRLAMAPDQSVVAAVVHDVGADRPVLRWFDPEAEAVTGDVDLPFDAHPDRLAWSEDGDLLFVSDTNRPAIWEVPRDGLPTEHVMPWPTLDVTPLFSMEQGRLVYVVPEHGREVWIYDIDSGTFRDVNASLPGVQGMRFSSPVTGIEAIPLTHLYRERTDDGVRRTGRSVAVSLHEGRVVFMEEGVGCLLQDELGPRTEVTGGLGAASDVSAPFQTTGLEAFLERNLHNSRHVLVNPCAGVARAESWTLRFDRNAAGWLVEGGVSGLQESIAFEDERYLSDGGEVSFVVRAGALPSREGWQMTFRVLEGILAADGTREVDGLPGPPMEVPGDPVFFHYVAGPTTGGWKQVDRRAFVLVPEQGGDLVSRVNPQEGSAEVRWE